MGQVLGDNLLGENDFPFISHFSDDDHKPLINHTIVLENYGAGDTAYIQKAKKMAETICHPRKIGGKSA